MHGGPENCEHAACAGNASWRTLPAHPLPPPPLRLLTKLIVTDSTLAQSLKKKSMAAFLGSYLYFKGHVVQKGHGDGVAKDSRKKLFFAKMAFSGNRNIDQPPYIYIYIAVFFLRARPAGLHLGQHRQRLRTCGAAQGQGLCSQELTHCEFAAAYLR